MRLIVVVGAVAAAVTACGSTGRPVVHDQLQPASSDASHDRVTSTIVINAGADETFAPPPAGKQPKLTAAQAWKRFADKADPKHHHTMPADADYQLGLITVPPSVTDVLAWGYRGPLGACAFHVPPPLLGRSASPTPTPTAAPPRCVEWTFIDADNGHQVESTQQIVTGPGSSPTPRPTPSSVVNLQSGGFLDATLERFSPDALVVQGPLSVIRWTFDMGHCTIDMHWFLPAEDHPGTPEHACRAAGDFDAPAATTFASRGHVFSAVAGHVDDRTTLVRLTLANGDTQMYDADDANRSWLFAVQRCGDVAGTAPVSVAEIDRDGHEIERLPLDLPEGAASGC